LFPDSWLVSAGSTDVMGDSHVQAPRTSAAARMLNNMQNRLKRFMFTS